MKIRGSLKISKGLRLISPGGLDPASGLSALSDSQGNVYWGHLAMPELDEGTTYSKKGTLVIKDNSVYYSLVDNAEGSDYLDTNFWADLVGGGDTVLTQDQIDALNSANSPNSGNPYMTLADINNLTILGTDTLDNISANANGNLNEIWITSTEGTDYFGNPVAIGDGLISTGVSYQWRTVGQLRGTEGVAGEVGPPGIGVIVKGTATSDYIVSRNPIPAGDLWISSDVGEDSYGGIIAAGDGVVSDGIGWYTIGPFRGPSGLPGYNGTYLIKGSVTWISGYTYFVRADLYVINGVLYSAEPVTATLNISDQFLDRKDIFVADTHGAIYIEEGIPAAPPVLPGLNTSLVVGIASIDIAKNTGVSPIAVSNTVYDENLGIVGGESDVSVISNNGATINTSNNDDSYSGTLSIKVIEAKNEIIQFALSSPVLVAAEFSGFTMRVKSLNPGSTCNITIRLFNGEEQVSEALNIADYGYNYTNNTDWQFITMSVVNLKVSSAEFDSIRLVYEDPSFTGQSDMLVDMVTYQFGVIYNVDESSSDSDCCYMSESVTATLSAGGISKDDIVPLGTNLLNFVRQIIAPVIDPTISSNASTYTTGVTASSREIGSTYTATLGGSLNRGSIDSKDAHPNVSLVGTETERIYGGTSGGIDTSSGAISFVLTSGSHRWTIIINYERDNLEPYYDSSGISRDNLDSSRGPGSVSATSAAVTARYYIWWASELFGDAPTDSTGIRQLSDKAWVGNITFEITIAPGEKDVAFYMPRTMTLDTATYKESSYADVKGEFTATDILVKDGGGTADVEYSMYYAEVPGTTGYAPLTATYIITVKT